MSEYSSGSCRPGLSELEETAVDQDLALLLAEDPVRVDQEALIALKTSARDQIAEMLVAGPVKDAMAQRIIEHHYSMLNPPDYAVYAYWSVIRKALALNPGSPPPSYLLTFVEGLAHSQGEADVEFQLRMVLSWLRVAPQSKEAGMTSQPAAAPTDFFESTLTAEEGPADDITSLVARLEEKSRLARNSLEERLMRARDRLDRGMSPGHVQDRLRLAARDGNYERIYSDIKNKLFTTDEGLNCAVTKQELDRLDHYYQDKNPFKLHDDIISGRFMTREGHKAAIAKCDRDRLAVREGDPDRLLKDIKAHIFFTIEGIGTAVLQQDRDRLVLHAADHIELAKDLRDGKFLTDEVESQALRLLLS